MAKEVRRWGLPHGNIDGKLDLAVTSVTTNSILVLLGKGDGTFPIPSDLATGDGPQFAGDPLSLGFGFSSISST
jgi:hypothetical protein